VRGIERFEGQSSLKTWLFRILVNRARTAGGRERRVESLWASDDVETADRFDRDGAWAVPPEPWSDVADDRLVARQIARRVRSCLADLPPGQRDAVLLRDVEGVPADQVCALLGISDGNLRVLLHRGRTRVRRALEAELGTA
jgi:RNA polymerase sigma-70 factor (ECF subfamily)